MIFFLKKTKQNKELEIISGIKVVRSLKRKKTITIRIFKDKKEILCPIKTPTALLKSFIYSKKKWIEKRILIQQKQEKEINKLNESYLLYKGKKLKFLNLEKNHNEVLIRKGYIYIPNKTYFENNKNQIRDELKKKSLVYLKRRIDLLSKNINIKYKNIKIKNYKRIWGCCSNKAEICLNWKLIMLPPGIISYVIIHELCHIYEPNHSKSFWNLVQKYEPDFKKKKKWLSQNGNYIIQY